jgi:hypothetical protein
VAVLIVPLEIGRIIVNSDTCESLLLLGIELILSHFIVELRVMRYLLSHLEIVNGSDQGGLL